MSFLFSKSKPALLVSTACVLLTLAYSADAKPPQESGMNKAADPRVAKKSSSDSDIVLSKNAETTLYLLAG